VRQGEQRTKTDRETGQKGNRGHGSTVVQRTRTKGQNGTKERHDPREVRDKPRRTQADARKCTGAHERDRQDRGGKALYSRRDEALKTGERRRAGQSKMTNTRRNRKRGRIRKRQRESRGR